MNLYVIDYHGTLDTLPDPVGYIQSLKGDPKVKVVIHTGDHLRVPRAVLAVADELWLKPKDLKGVYLRGINEVIIADDERLILRSWSRYLRAMFEGTHQLWTPLDLQKHADHLRQDREAANNPHPLGG